MSQQVTIQVSDHVARHAAQIAARARRSVEEVLAAWLESAVTEKPVEELSDGEALALTELNLTDEQEATLGHLLEQNREAALGAEGRRQLDELMRLYERGLLRKSQALRVAVHRELREPSRRESVRHSGGDSPPRARGRAQSLRLLPQPATLGNEQTRNRASHLARPPLRPLPTRRKKAHWLPEQSAVVNGQR